MLLLIIAVCSLFGIILYDYKYGTKIKTSYLTNTIKRIQKNRLTQTNNKTKIIIIVDDENINIKRRHKKIISIENSQKILDILRKCTRKQKSLGIILHATGGTIESSDIISHAMLEHDLPICCFIPKFANSAASLLALATDTIYLDKYAYMSPADPQMTIIPGNSSDNNGESEITVSSKMLMDYFDFSNKYEKDIDICSRNIFDILEAKQLHEDNILTIKKIINKKSRTCKNNQNNIIHKFCSGNYPHHAPLYYGELKKLGVHVQLGIPDDIQCIFRLFEKNFCVNNIC
jgi:ATP-dependent protease ClpP protease subunit